MEGNAGEWLPAFVVRPQGKPDFALHKICLSRKGDTIAGDRKQSVLDLNFGVPLRLLRDVPFTIRMRDRP
jgi:hypothetical protein